MTLYAQRNIPPCFYVERSLTPYTNTIHTGEMWKRFYMKNVGRIRTQHDH